VPTIACRIAVLKAMRVISGSRHPPQGIPDRSSMRRSRSQWSCFAVPVFASLLLVPKPAKSAQAVVWQIGKFDQSSYEFKGRFNLSDPQFHVVYAVGKSDPARDWPALQAGSENPEAGKHPHPYTISFDLPAKPKGVYRLSVSTIISHSRTPALQVEINGKSGLFYFDRKVSYYAGDGGFDSPIYSSARLDITLPTSALRIGKNQLMLTAMDDPANGSADSWLAYDALSLTNDPSARPRHTARVDVKPTVFYVSERNQLAERTQVTVTLAEKVSKGNLELNVGAENFRQALSSKPDFGQQRFSFDIPKFNGPAAAEVKLRVNGKSRTMPVTLKPARQWTIFVVPHAHLDIGFTDYQAKVAEVHNRNVDKLLEEIQRFSEMRFCLDGSWIVQNYLATRDAEARRRFLDLARHGTIGVPAQLANLMTGYPTLEELFRSTSYSLYLHHRYGIPFDYANITDVPSYTWSYPSVLNALGICYLAAASNNDRAPILLYGRWNEKSPFWWEGPDGSKVLMSYSRQYFQLSFVCGVPAQAASCRESLPVFLQQYEAPSYKPDVVLMFGSQIENTDLIPGEPQFVKAWNAKYAYPKMVLSTFPDYFHYVDQHYGKELRTVDGDFGPYWEDGFGTDAKVGILARSNQQRALSAEKLATIGTLVQRYAAVPRNELRQLWEDMVLYSEHTFTSWGGYSRPQSDETVRQLAYKDQHATDAHLLVNNILDSSFSQLADQIHIPAPALLVFNSLSWKRSGLVETDLDDGEVLKEYPSMKVVPYEVLRRGPGYDHIRFLAEDVPSMGYKCYAIVAVTRSSAQPETNQPPVSNSMENQYYRVEFDPAAGAIKSIYDKQLGRELVDSQSPYRFDQYLYVSGGDEGETQIVYFRKPLPLAKLTISPSRDGRVVSIRRTPYGQIMTYQTSGLHAPSIRTDVILFNGEKKIEFVDHLLKESVSHKEAVYFAFPFAVRNPSFSFEIQNGWVNPAKNILLGGCLEWFTVQHWVRVAGDGVAAGLVPVDAPLVTLGDINRGRWPLKFQPKSSTVFSYVLNNYWHTNFRRVQSCDFTFHYVVTSGASLPAEELGQLGRASMTPMEARHLIGNDKYDDPARPLSPGPASFLTVSDRDVAVVDWKAADNGQGTILRLLEIGGRDAPAVVRLPLFTIQKAFLDNAAELNQSPLAASNHSFHVDLKPHQIVTVRLRIKKASPDVLAGPPSP
jgi:alpha-mannosidase